MMLVIKMCIKNVSAFVNLLFFFPVQSRFKNAVRWDFIFAAIHFLSEILT